MSRIGTAFWKFTKIAPVLASTVDFKTFFVMLESRCVSSLCNGTVLDGSGGLFGLAFLFSKIDISSSVSLHLRFIKV